MKTETSQRPQLIRSYISFSMMTYKKKNLTYIKALSGNFFFFQVLNLLLARTLIGNVRVFCPEQTDPWRTESKTRRKTASAPTQNFATGTDVEQMGQK